MFYDKMLKEKQRLTNLIEENRKKIQQLPEGTFYCVESDTYQKWYKKSKGCPQQYIPKKDQEYAAQKLQQYAQAQIYLNRNLILTSEGSGHPLTVQDIEKSIMYIIQ